MADLITALLLIGFFSPAFRVIAVSENKKSNEHFIALRDYDFVGEDPRLKAALAERMAVLQGDVDLSGLPPPRRGRGAPAPPAPAYQPKADFLQSSLNFPQMVNVSLDYAEFYNASELIRETNVSRRSPAPGPGLRGTPAPGAALGLRGAPAPGAGLGLRGAQAPGADPGLRGVPAPNEDTLLRGDTAPAAGPPGPEAAPPPGPVANQFPGPGGRRVAYSDPSYWAYNKKVMDIMKQLIYATQRKILELDPVIKRYEADPRFRMAYIFNRLDEWLHDLRTVYYAMYVWRQWPRRVKRLIWYYEHTLRINIDITYSIEHLVFLHTEYMKNMEALVSTKERKEMKERKKRNQMKIKKHDKKSK